MNKKELLNGLRYYQKWRKDGDGEMPYPKDVTRYIDSAISVIEKTSLQAVNAAIYRKELRDKVISTKGAMILDGYEPEDSCIKFMNELIDEL